MQILLVRHAQSIWQTERGGDWDSSLTALGTLQARRLADWLSQTPQVGNGASLQMRTLAASPLARARETAEPIAAAIGLPALHVEALTEATFHVADELPCRPSPLAAHAAFAASMRYAAFRAQADAALGALVRHAEQGGSPLLAVTHGGLIKTLLRVVACSDTICFRLYNTGINMIEWRRGRWHIVHLNLWDHLPAELRTE